jgi:hypothetical protein
MCSDNKDVGSLRCKACGEELKENEFVFCSECNEQSMIYDNHEKMLKTISKDYIE